MCTRLKPVRDKASDTHGCVSMLRSQWGAEKDIQLYLPAEPVYIRQNVKGSPL